MLTRLAHIVLFAHDVQCLVGRQAAPGWITSMRRLRPGSPVVQVQLLASRPDHHARVDLVPNPAGRYSSTNPLVALFNGG